MTFQLKRFCIIWLGVVSWQACLIVLTFGPYFARQLPILGWVSYLITPGYALTYLWGEKPWGPMNVFDWRWILGGCMLLLMSVIGALQKSRGWSLFYNVSFVFLHLTGSLFTFLNMAGAIT